MAMKHSYLVDKEDIVDLKEQISLKQEELLEILEGESVDANLTYAVYGQIKGLIESVKLLKLYETPVEEVVIMDKQNKISSKMLKLKNASQGLASE